LDELPPLLEGIPCREGTSCPDQLLRALTAIRQGTLFPAHSFLICEDPKPKARVGLLGQLGGDVEALKASLARMRAMKVDAVCCVGNLTGGSQGDEELLRLLLKEKVLAIQGEGDWRRAQEPETAVSALERDAREYLQGLPQVMVFRLMERRALGFFGEYVQALPGYSDFEPFALEMNMVCNLSRFLRDEELFPALEAMTPQFAARIVLFGQTPVWRHWRVGGVDFINVGPARTENGVAWGLLEDRGGEVVFGLQDGE
jgi:predicted phosphodiesterase